LVRAPGRLGLPGDDLPECFAEGRVAGVEFVLELVRPSRPNSSDDVHVVVRDDPTQFVKVDGKE
jgi:hypothetical protein